MSLPRAIEHGQISVDPSVLGPPRQTAPARRPERRRHRPRDSGQPEGRLGIDEIGASLEYLLQRLTGFQRPTGLDQDPRHPIAEIVEPWPSSSAR